MSGYITLITEKLHGWRGLLSKELVEKFYELANQWLERSADDKTPECVTEGFILLYRIEVEWKGLVIPYDTQAVETAINAGLPLTLAPPDFIIRRMFEPMSAGWEAKYPVGIPVRCSRYNPMLGIPVGAPGTVKAIADPYSNDYAKGRVLDVAFDLDGFNVAVPQAIKEAALLYDLPPQDFYKHIQTNLTPMDVMEYEKPD